MDGTNGTFSSSYFKHFFYLVYNFFPNLFLLLIFKKVWIKKIKMSHCPTNSREKPCLRRGGPRKVGSARAEGTMQPD